MAVPGRSSISSNRMYDSPLTMAAVMSIWWDKTYYDGRYVVGDDLYHRIFEVIHLSALASTVVHIRTVDVLSHPSDHFAPFGLCLSLAISKLLFLIRQIEVYFAGVGQREVRLMKENSS